MTAEARQVILQHRIADYATKYSDEFLAAERQHTGAEPTQAVSDAVVWSFLAGIGVAATVLAANDGGELRAQDISVAVRNIIAEIEVLGKKSPISDFSG